MATGTHYCKSYVLKLGNSVDSVVFKASKLFVMGILEGFIPRKRFDDDQGKDLENPYDDCLKYHGKYWAKANQSGLRWLGNYMAFICFVPAEEERKIHNKENVYVQELEIRQISANRVKEHRGEKFREGVQYHKFTYAERRD